jgi:hypothetical protein
VSPSVWRDRVSVAGVLAAVLFAPGRAAAQVNPEPRLIFSIFGGVAKGPDLYEIPQQPLLLVFTPEYDTLALRRQTTTAPMIGVNATVYRSSGFGLVAEAAYVGVRIDDDCRMLYEHTDLQRRNYQVCTDITRRVGTVSNVGFTLGGAYRLASRSAVSPYIRLQGGVSIQSASLVEMVGTYNEVTADNRIVPRNRVVIADESTISVHPMVAGALGVSFALSPGYHIRAEVRDHLMRFQRPTGPAGDVGDVPIEGFWGHAPALVFGFDIVLERRRGRRY